MSWEDGPTWERGRPARMHSRCVLLSFLRCGTWHNFAYLSHSDQPRTPPLPAHCVKDECGLHRSRAEWRRLIR